MSAELQPQSMDGRVPYVDVGSGRWGWTKYGGDQEHSEALALGNVEFHAFL